MPKASTSKWPTKRRGCPDGVRAITMAVGDVVRAAGDTGLPEDVGE
jgi:hypothetical protein